MRIQRNPITASLIAVGLLSIGCAPKQTTSETIDRSKLQLFAPLAHAKADSAAPEQLVSLGRMLYYDARLSKTQTVSCNSCHPLSRYGADGEPTSPGYEGQRGNRNSPSVYNAAAQFVQFWDGRAPDVEQQAKGPMLNPVEMGMPSAKAVVQVLQSMPEYVAAFRRAFPKERNPVTFDHAAEAIGAFERNLVTPARWDRFLRGEEAALAPAEKAGFNAFVAEGCAGCHAGALVGGNAFQRLGLARPYPNTTDPGRFTVTKKENDRMAFKVPSLRNVAMTGPYFHNGQVGTLRDAVTQMADYQLGKKLTDPQAEAIVTWLKTLTGEIPADYTKEPVLPKSTARTPKPAKA